VHGIINERQCNGMPNAEWISDEENPESGDCQCLPGSYPRVIPALESESLESRTITKCERVCSMRNITDYVDDDPNSNKLKSFFCANFTKNLMYEGGTCYMKCNPRSTMFTPRNPLKNVLPFAKCLPNVDNTTVELVVFPFDDTICSENMYAALYRFLAVGISIASILISCLVSQRNMEIRRSKNVFSLWLEKPLRRFGRLYTARQEELEEQQNYQLQRLLEGEKYQNSSGPNGVVVDQGGENNG